MKRLADWNIHLEDYFFEHLNTPFQWGKFDCVMFVAGAMKVVTGERVIPSELSWTSYRGAMKALRKYSDGTVKGSVAKFASDFDRIRPISIRLGDLCIVKNEQNEDVCSIFSGRGPMVATPDGVKPTLPELISMAWRY